MAARRRFEPRTRRLLSTARRPPAAGGWEAVCTAGDPDSFGPGRREPPHYMSPGDDVRFRIAVAEFSFRWLVPFDPTIFRLRTQTVRSDR
jgi:hypothetical protein